MPVLAEPIAVVPVGITLLDQQHNALFAVLERLENLANTPAQSESVVAAVDSLFDYAQIHLADEEEFLRKAGYPLLASHAASHRLFIDAIMDMMARLERGEDIQPRVVRTIRDWLAKHINSDDAAYAQFLREAQAARAAGN